MITILKTAIQNFISHSWIGRLSEFGGRFVHRNSTVRPFGHLCCAVFPPCDLLAFSMQ